MIAPASPNTGRCGFRQISERCQKAIGFQQRLAVPLLTSSRIEESMRSAVVSDEPALIPENLGLRAQSIDVGVRHGHVGLAMQDEHWGQTGTQVVKRGT